jgi:hypothetical protein
VVSRINLVGNSVTSEFISPNEAIFGREVNYKKDLALRFGDYCEIHEYDEVTNTMKARTVAAIALMSTGNIQGRWWFMKLNTGKAVRRDRWVEKKDMIAKLNNMADNSGPGSKGMDFMYEGRLIDDDMETEIEAIGDQAASGTEKPSQLPSREQVELLSDDAAAAELGISAEEAEPEQTVVRSNEVATAPMRDPIEHYMPPESEETEGGHWSREGDNIGPNDAGTEVGEQPSELSATIPPASVEADTSRADAAFERLHKHNTRRAKFDGLGWRERKATEAQAAERLYGMRIGVADALNRLGRAAVDSIIKELVGIHEAGSMAKVRKQDLSAEQKKRIIRNTCQMGISTN